MSLWWWYSVLLIRADEVLLCCIMKSHESVFHCHSAFMHLCRVCFRPVHAVTHSPTWVLLNIHHILSTRPTQWLESEQKDMFNQALKTQEPLTKQPGTASIPAPSRCTHRLHGPRRDLLGDLGRLTDRCRLL